LIDAQPLIGADGMIYAASKDFVLALTEDGSLWWRAAGGAGALHWLDGALLASGRARLTAYPVDIARLRPESRPTQ
jgi:outer membrane protein assembly factor BamB